LSRKLEAGMTFINKRGTSRLGQRNIPFGGVKQSGIGRESSEVGLADTSTITRSIFIGNREAAP